MDLGAIEVFVVQSPDLAAALLNEKFTVEALKGMDAQVGRIMRLAQLRPATTPSAQTNRYIEEAERAYIAGLFQGCVTRSRASLEQALKDKLGRQKDSQRIAFDDLVKEAKSGLTFHPNRAKRYVS